MAPAVNASFAACTDAPNEREEAKVERSEGESALRVRKPSVGRLGGGEALRGRFPKLDGGRATALRMSEGDSGISTAWVSPDAPANTACVGARRRASVRVGRRTMNQRLPLALHQLVPVYAALLRELVANQRDSYALRDAVTRLLAAAPLICRAARDEARADPTVDGLLFYELTRLQGASTVPTFFLDECPATVAVFGVSASVTLPVGNFQQLGFDDVLADRKETISKLEGKAITPQTLRQLDAAHQTPDLPAALPRSVRIFMSRLRAVHVGLRAAKPASEFAQCQHARCNRFFYAGSAVASTWLSSPEETYACRVGGLASFDADRRRFCSRVCARQWWEQYAAAAGMSPGNRLQLRVRLPLWASDTPRRLVVCDFGTDDVARRRHSGRRRPAKEFRAALCRNKQAVAAMRATRRAHTRALSREALHDARSRVTRALTVDACVLYAAKLCAESGVLHRDTADGIPGEVHNWRVGPSSVFERAACILKPIVDASIDGASDPCERMLNDAHASLLGAVKRRVLQIFVEYE